MQYTPRTIAFLCEVLHPPQVVDPAPIQRYHNQLFESGEPEYRSFNVTPTGSVLSNPVTRPGAVSSVEFLGDRYRFREELSSLTVEEFGTRVRSVSEAVAGLQGLQIFTAQVVTIRTLINPRNFRDSRSYLKQGMFGFGDETTDFEREPQLFGLRLVFPPSQEEPNAFTLRVESFANDPRSIFLENQGSFGPTMLARGTEGLSGCIEETYKFLTERALRFLENFDVRLEA